MDYYLRGIGIGLLFGIPVGAVGAMTVQRAWSQGFRAGFLTGLGSSMADCLYAMVGVFGLTFLSDFLLGHQTIITLLGGSFLILMGIKLLLQKSGSAVREVPTESGLRLFLSAFAIGITNPTAILTFLFAFTYFGIGEIQGLWNGLALVLGVFTGTQIWWVSLSALAAEMLRRKAGNFSYRDTVFGTLLILIGGAVILKAIL